MSEPQRDEATVVEGEVIGAQVPAVVEAGTPAAFIADAIKQGLPIETMERLFALYQQRQADDARKQFFEAMTKFQSIVPPILKDRSVGYEAKSGGAVDYRYASLSHIVGTIKAPLAECGLSFRFEQEDIEDGIKVTCIVTHIAGHSERTSMSGPADTSGKKNAIQSRGSSNSYLKRYTVGGALGLVIDEDDDGRSSQRGAPSRQRQPSSRSHPLDGKVEQREERGVAGIQAKDQWRPKTQGRQEKCYVCANLHVVFFTQSNPESNDKAKRWSDGMVVSHLIDRTWHTSKANMLAKYGIELNEAWPDPVPCAATSEVRPATPKPEAKPAQPGSAVAASCASYYKLVGKDTYLSLCAKILGRDKQDAAIEPHRCQEPAKLSRLQAALQAAYVAVQAERPQEPVGDETEPAGAPDGDEEWDPEALSDDEAPF